MINENIVRDLEKTNVRFCLDYDTSLASSFRVGGRAELAVFPKNAQELLTALSLASRDGVRSEVIGNASNLLFDDRGFSGTVISTVKIKEIFCVSESVFYADSGVMLPSLCAFALKNGYTGFEGLCSVPATVGGALTLNAGAYGCEIADKLLAYEVFSPERGRQLVVADKGLFSYRASPIPHSAQTVLCAYFSSETGEIAAITERIELNKALRRKSQPINERSCC